MKIWASIPLLTARPLIPSDPLSGRVVRGPSLIHKRPVTGAYQLRAGVFAINLKESADKRAGPIRFLLRAYGTVEQVLGDTLHPRIRTVRS